MAKRAAARAAAAAAAAEAAAAAAPTGAAAAVAPSGTGLTRGVMCTSGCHSAASCSQPPPSRKPALSKLVEYPGEPGEVARLLAAGEVEPHGCDLFGLTALHKFASWDKVDLLDLLLPHLDAAQCNQQVGADQLPPLHAAADMGARRAT